MNVEVETVAVKASMQKGRLAEVRKHEVRLLEWPWECDDCPIGGFCSGLLCDSMLKATWKIETTTYLGEDKEPEGRAGYRIARPAHDGICVACGAPVPEGTWVCPQCKEDPFHAIKEKEHRDE